MLHLFNIPIFPCSVERDLPSGRADDRRVLLVKEGERSGRMHPVQADRMVSCQQNLRRFQASSPEVVRFLSGEGGRMSEKSVW